MSIPGPAPIVSVMDVLRQCGWVRDADRPWSEEPALKYNFGNFELSAGVLTNQYFRRVVSFQGHYRDLRTMAETVFDMPERVESREQVLAWIVYGLRRSIPLAITPAWIEEGRRLQHELPWAKHMAAYNARPVASVDRMWMKPLGKVLREAAASAAEDERCLIDFDGHSIRFELPAKTYLVQADGSEPWPHASLVRLRDLAALPQRWMRSTISVSYWDGYITIDNRRFAASVAKRPGDAAGETRDGANSVGGQT
jgi:hypothetical protein